LADIRDQDIYRFIKEGGGRVMWSTVAFLGKMILYLTSGLKVAKENSFRTLFLPRKHFYLANLFLFFWIVMSVYFR
jgi:hypothetical protein